MGLNDFVSLFYGSAQNLNASSSTSTSSLFLSTSTNTSATSTDVIGKPALTATFSQTASATLEMLKNHKNSKLPKFHLNDFPSNDVKFSRNMTLTSLKTPRQKGIILSANNGGGGGENVDNTSVSGKSGRKNKNATLNSSSASLHKLHSSSSASLQAVAEQQTTTNAKGTVALDATLVSTTTGTSTSTSSSSTTTTTGKIKTSAGNVQFANEMDILKVPGLRKKSSFLWNSFRMPRKQKSSAGGGSGGGESRA